MGWQEDKAAYQRTADAQLKGISPTKKAAFKKLTDKIKSGQPLNDRENYAYTHNFPEFFGKTMYENDRGSDPNRQGAGFIRDNFSSNAPANPNHGSFGTTLPRFDNTTRPMGVPGFHQPGPGNSLASWPATTPNPAGGGGGTFGQPGTSNPADYWRTHTAPGMGAPAGFPAGTNDMDRGSDPNRQGTPVGINDNDRGSDPNRQPVGPTGNPRWGQVPDFFPDGGGDPTAGLITQLPSEQMPNIPNVTLAWHDFTNQAKQKVAGAYAPLYEAINQGKTNATIQEKRSDAIIKGMYDQLAARNIADKTATGNQYNAEINQTKADNASLQNTISGAGASANAELAKTMADAGLGGHSGTAAADILSGSVGQDSAAALAAQTQGNADLANIRSQKTNQEDYITNTAAADRQQGEATREGLVNQLSDVLRNYDQQQLQTKGNEAQQALSLNQQMGQNDFTAQQGSNANTWNAYNAAMGQYQSKVSTDQANVGLQNNATMAEIEAAQKQAQLQQDQNQFDLQYGQTAAKNAADQARAEAAQKAKDELDAKKLGISVEQLKINQQNADTAARGNTQGTNPNAPGYDPMKDPTSPQYLAAHNPVAIYRNSLLGFLGNPQRADTMQSIVDKVFKQRNTGDTPLSQIDFTKALITEAQKFNFTPQEAQMAAEAYQRAQGSSPTVIPAQRY